MIDKIHWLGHASFRIDGSKTVYIDPWKLSLHPPADLILITHDHFDHLSLPDIQKIKIPGTRIVAPPGCSESLPDAEIIQPGRKLDIHGVVVEAVFAYNTNKKFHPKSADRVGYILAIDGTLIYHAGDTDRIPEMKDYRCDIALLPVSGTYVMTAEEAAAAVRDIGTRMAVPMHWGDIVGSERDAEKFRQLAACEVRILRKE